MSCSCLCGSVLCSIVVEEYRFKDNLTRIPLLELVKGFDTSFCLEDRKMLCVGARESED